MGYEAELLSFLNSPLGAMAMGMFMAFITQIGKDNHDKDPKRLSVQAYLAITSVIIGTGLVIIKIFVPADIIDSVIKTVLAALGASTAVYLGLIKNYKNYVMSRQDDEDVEI